MKKTLLLVLVLFFGLLSYGQDKKTFSKDNISFEYPGHWIIRDFPGQYILISEPPNEELSVMATFDVDVDSNAIDLREFVRNYISMMETNIAFSNFKVISKQRRKYLGENAFELHCTATLQSIPMEWKSIFFARNGVIYKLTATAMIGQFLLLKDERERLFGTFKLN